MSYGTTTYGSVPLGGAAAASEQVFLPLMEYAVGSYEGSAVFTGSGSFYSVLARVNSDVIEVSFEVFTHNDPNETPQSQGTFGGFGLFFQSVVGAARFIIVRATVPTSTQFFSVHGRPGD